MFILWARGEAQTSLMLGDRFGWLLRCVLCLPSSCVNALPCRASIYPVYVLGPYSLAPPTSLGPAYPVLLFFPLVNDRFRHATTMESVFMVHTVRFALGMYIQFYLHLPYILCQKAHLLCFASTPTVPAPKSGENILSLGWCSHTALNPAARDGLQFPGVLLRCNVLSASYPLLGLALLQWRSPLSKSSSVSLLHILGFIFLSAHYFALGSV